VDAGRQSLDGSNDGMMARIGMVHPGSVGGSTQSDQQAQGKKRTHRNHSGRYQLLIHVVLVTAVPSSCGFTIDQIGGNDGAPL
jgi:hypothetical protein